MRTKSAAAPGTWPPLWEAPAPAPRGAGQHTTCPLAFTARNPFRGLSSRASVFRFNPISPCEDPQICRASGDPTSPQTVPFSEPGLSSTGGGSLRAAALPVGRELPGLCSSAAGSGRAPAGEGGRRLTAASLRGSGLSLQGTQQADRSRTRAQERALARGPAAAMSAQPSA